jgi:hypothetical protein
MVHVLKWRINELDHCEQIALYIVSYMYVTFAAHTSEPDVFRVKESTVIERKRPEEEEYKGQGNKENMHRGEKREKQHRRGEM